MNHLFSYGTLRQRQVQLKTFGRELIGHNDTLSNYCVSEVEIKDAYVVRLSGKKIHPILEFSGDPKDKVFGSVFALNDQELTMADNYEADDYVRVEAVLESGIKAWIYTAHQ